MIQTSLECCLGGCPWRQGDRSHVIGAGASGAGCVRYTTGTVAGVPNVPKGPKEKTRHAINSTQKVPGTLRSAAVVTAQRVLSTPSASNSSPYPNSDLPPRPDPSPPSHYSYAGSLSESLLLFFIHTYYSSSTPSFFKSSQHGQDQGGKCLPTHPCFGGVALASCLFYPLGLPSVVHTMSMHTIPLPSTRLTVALC